jgi:hypothetical protein
MSGWNLGLKKFSPGARSRIGPGRRESVLTNAEAVVRRVVKISLKFFETAPPFLRKNQVNGPVSG